MTPLTHIVEALTTVETRAARARFAALADINLRRAIPATAIAARSPEFFAPTADPAIAARDDHSRNLPAPRSTPARGAKIIATLPATRQLRHGDQLMHRPTLSGAPVMLTPQPAHRAAPLSSPKYPGGPTVGAPLVRGPTGGGAGPRASHEGEPLTC